jgi:hypothetical protein
VRFRRSLAAWASQRAVFAFRHQQSEVIEAGAPAARLRSGFLAEDKELVLGSPERGLMFVALKGLQPDLGLVVSQRSIQIGDSQANDTHERPIGDLCARGG